MVKKVFRTLAPALGLVFVGWLDYATDPRLVFWPFYLVVLVPTALTRPLPVSVGYGVLAAVILLAYEVLGRPELATSIFPYWKAFAQLIAFTMVTYMMPKLLLERRRLERSESILIRQRTELQTLNRQLITALEDLSRSRHRQVAEGLGQHAHVIRELHGELERGLSTLRALRGDSASIPAKSGRGTPYPHTAA